MNIQTVPKKYLFPVIATLLFCLTFAPHTWQWEAWRPWINTYTYLLALIGGCALLYWIAPTRWGLGRVGQALKYAGRLPDNVWVAAAAVTFFCLTYFLSGVLFNHVPAEMDSMAQYAGAKAMAQGHWYVKSHLLWRFFETNWFFNNGKFYNFYPPGHMMMLAVGFIIGNPAIINPLLGTLSLMATYALTEEIGGRYAARISLILFLCSPFIVFLASEFDNRSTALLMATLFTLFYIRTIKTHHWKNAVMAGMAMGYLCITRPQTAVPYGLPFVLHCLWMLATQYRCYWKNYAIMLGSFLPFILFFMYYNLQTTGAPFLTGYELFFGKEVLPGALYTNWDGWKNWPAHFTQAIQHMQLLHSQLFGWPVSSLFLAYLLFLGNAQKPFCGLLAAVYFSVFFGLSLTGYIGNIFGPRYFYELNSLLIAVTALSIHRLPAVFRKSCHVRIPLNQWRGLSTIIFLCLTAIALSITDHALYAAYGDHYRDGNIDFTKRIESSVQKPALVFLQDIQQYQNICYTQPPDDKADIIFAHDLGDTDNQSLIQYYPGRFAYVVRGNKIEPVPNLSAQ